MASSGSFGVTVTNPTPGGGTSAAQQLQVLASDNRLRELSYAASDIVADPTRNLIYASVGSSSATSANSLIAINPSTGAVVTTLSLSSAPGRIAVSDDGSYLYVSIPETPAINRYLLPSLTPDISWSLSSAAGDLEVAPGAPHTVAVSVNGSDLNRYTRTVLVYDDGVARPLHPADSYAGASFDTFAWGANASTLYATQSPFSGGPEYVLSVGATGPTLTSTFYGALGDFLRRLTYNATTNRLYDGYGNAVDPSTGSRIGHYTVQNTVGYGENDVAVDSANNRVFFLNEDYLSFGNSSITADLQAFDLKGFTYLNALTVPGLSGSRIIRWGTSGLAIGGGPNIFLVDGSFVSSSGTSSPVGTYAGVSPTLSSLSPQTVNAGDGPVTVLITGKNFTPAVNATWNSHTLPVSYVSSTQVSVTFPAAYLVSPVSAAFTLTNGPGTEPSNPVPFTVLPSLGPNTQIAALGVSGQDMVWDSTRGLLYVAVTSPTAPNGNSLVAVNPTLPAIQNVVPTGYQPSALGISDDGKYLYTGFQTLAAVNRYALADFSLNLSIPLTQGSTNYNFAGDVKVAPGQNQTIAVSLGSPSIEPRDTGGLVIFDNATARTKTLAYGGPDTYKLSWGKDSTHLYANSDPEFQPQSFAVVSIDSMGITGRTATSTLTNVGLRPHYDAGTNLAYDDGGRVADPSTGAQVGSFAASGLMVPDSTLNRAFVLSAGNAANSYVLNIFDLTHETLLKSITIPGISGYATQMTRWGSQGIAILTDSPGMLYILQGSDVSGVSSAPANSITLSPATAIAGASSGLTITVAGSGFLPTSVAIVNGAQQPTTFVNSTQLTFQLTAAEQSFARYLSVSVSNAAAGGGATPDAVLEVDNAVPAIASLSSPTLQAGAAATTITVIGTGFVPTSVVRFSGTVLPTTYISSTSLSVSLPATNLATAGFFNITVYNAAPGGGASAAAVLEVDNPTPAISSFTPATIPAGAGSQTITIFGTGFSSATTVSIQGASITPTYSGSTVIYFTLPASYFTSSGNISILLSNPAPGGGSVSASLVVSGGLPTITSLAPSTVIQGSTTPATVTVTGSNFTTGSVVQLSGQSRTTTFISSSQLSFVLTVADQANVGSRAVTVVNPQSNGGASGPAVLMVAAATATPVITSVSPAQFTLNSGDTYIYVSASGITSSSYIQWNGTRLSSYPSSNYVSGLVPANLLTSVGTANVTVVSPTATPQSSNPYTVTVTAPSAPILTSISPSTGPINTAFTVTLSGTNFTGSSVVTINGDALSTTFVSSTQLTATVPASEVVLGNDFFAVSTPAPGGGLSGTAVYTAYVAQSNNSMIFNPADGFFYLSVPGFAGAPYGNTIVSLDPLTGALGTPIPVGSEPNRMTLTSDGRYLWVGLDGANAVRKVDLTAHTAGLQFALPALNGGSKAAALAAVPGQTDSVLVAYGNLTYGTSGLGLFDSGVVRGSTLPVNSFSLQIDGSRGEIYSAANNYYQVLTYSSSGLASKTSVTESSLLVTSPDDRIQTIDGRTYSDNGLILNAETGASLGAFTASPYAAFSTAIDSTQGLAFALDSSSSYGNYPNRIQIFNTSDFSSSNSASIPLSFSYLTPSLSTLTRWGANGLAFRNSTSVYAFRSNLVKDLSASKSDLAITIAASGGSTTGAATTYTAQVSNLGPSTATEVRFTALPPSTGLVASITTTSGTCTLSTSPLCDLGTLSLSGTATVTLVVNQLSAGTASLTASVSSSEADPNAANNQAAATSTITGPAYSAAPLLIAIKPSSILAGAADTTITLTGTGFGAGSVVQLDNVALSTSVISATQLTATVPAASLAALSWHAVTVATPAPGGGVSAVLPLTIYSAIKAGANRLAYDPFSRKLIASLGSSTSSGNSIEFVTPDTGTTDSSVSIGSEPTRLALSDDGQALYVLLTGGNSLVRFNMLTQTSGPSFALTPPSGSNSSAFTFAIQPGGENTLALNIPPLGMSEIVDYDPVAGTASARSATTGYRYGRSPQFLNASSLLVVDGSSSLIADYPINMSGIGTLDSTKSSPVPNLAPFKLANNLLFTANGGVSDLSTLPGHAIGSFPVTINNTEAAVAPDPTIGRAFFLAGYDGVSAYRSPGLNGLAAFDTNTFLPVGFVPLSIADLDGISNSAPVEVLRWGQDGVAALTSSGTLYLVRGAAVLPQLMQSNTSPTLTSVSPGPQHGSGNTVLTITGSNFLPGAAVTWNGTYRFTSYVDATHVMVYIPASDLTAAGSASVTVANAGSTASAPLMITIN